MKSEREPREHNARDCAQVSDSDFDMESQSRDNEQQRKAAQQAADAANKARTRCHIPCQ